MKFKKIGLVIAGNALWGREAPIDSLTDWNLQYVIKKLNNGEYEFVYVVLPFLGREAVKACIQTRYVDKMESRQLNSIYFGPSCEDATTFVRNLELFFPEYTELGVAIFGAGLPVQIFQQMLAEFTLRKEKDRIVLLTEVGRPDCNLPMLINLTKTT